MTFPVFPLNRKFGRVRGHAHPGSSIYAVSMRNFELGRVFGGSAISLNFPIDLSEFTLFAKKAAVFRPLVRPLVDVVLLRWQLVPRSPRKPLPPGHEAVARRAPPWDVRYRRSSPDSRRG